MARLKIKLTRNLRRTILQGHPWIYSDNITAPGIKVERAQLAQVIDSKNEHVAWAIYDPHSPLSLRILSTQEAPPHLAFFEKKFERAYQLRQGVRCSTPGRETDAYRLFNGEGDLLPGLICDVYNKIAVIQFDGPGPTEFWDKNHITKWILQNTECKTVVEKTRRSPTRSTELIGGDPYNNEVLIHENGVKFEVNIEKGQKTGFFLDQRENRDHVRRSSQGKTVLNLFSYTGGFSIYAGLGQASKVASLDVSQGAIESAEKNWALNGLDPAKHIGLCVDVFEYLETVNEQWDHILVDPPSMSHSEDQNKTAKLKYIEVFAAAAKRVKKGGQLSLSSCSSHVTHEDFFEITNECLSQARRTGQILRVGGQGPDHPFPHACHEFRYLKFIHLILD